ncbi:MAG: SUMF1/EgtB/PvdO family nonheme iron enzyme [Anaerolineae bacterium]|nr:SUMF1/EgtB/PvdO family nonheme iron enzyme [Anaerolineae bacterium]
MLSHMEQSPPINASSPVITNIPERIGKYQIEQEIGQGGFAIVYRAYDTVLDRQVAIKVLRNEWAENDVNVKRFYREARCAASLRHPNIVTIYEIGELHDGSLYLAMEYLPGISLAEMFNRDANLSIDQKLTILEQMADALDYAHKQNLVHRDVTPKNIMVEWQENNSLHCVLTDFGLVKVLESADALTTGPLGTLGYMAPEQIDFNLQRAIGPAVDIYALGVIAYRMLAGRMPFEGNLANVLMAHLSDLPPNPSTVCDQVPQKAGLVLLKALAKAPEDRYSNTKQMVASLRSAMQIPTGHPVYPPQVVRSAGLELEERVQHPKMIMIPAGPFWIGSDARDPMAADNEKPRHQEYVAQFQIARCPITNGQYQTFVRATNHPAPAHWQAGWIPPGKENHPVVNVSYLDAQDYCRWLSKHVDCEIDLPTEFEWEKAAGGTAAQPRHYPWGNIWNAEYCNSAESGIRDTTSVDRYEKYNRSPYDVIDMVGNVWEWTSSLYRPYPHANHYSLAYSIVYVVRGGSWQNGREDARVSVRGRYKPEICRPYLGFRVVARITR